MFSSLPCCDFIPAARVLETLACKSSHRIVSFALRRPRARRGAAAGCAPGSERPPGWAAPRRPCTAAEAALSDIDGSEQGHILQAGPRQDAPVQRQHNEGLGLEMTI